MPPFLPQPRGFVKVIIALYSSESGLFNGLRRIQIKNLSHVMLCLKRHKLFSSLLSVGSAQARIGSGDAQFIARPSAFSKFLLT